MNRFKYQPYAILLALAILPLFSGCFHGKGWAVKYDLQGVVIPSDINTASVKQFQNKAPQVQPTMALSFTEKLRDKITSQTRLKIVNGDGDVNFEGIIVDYSTQPVAPTAATITTALNRLTIKISVKYTNSKDSKADYEQEFSKYFDYPSAKNLIDVENGDEKFTQTIDDLINDIFNRAFVNW